MRILWILSELNRGRQEKEKAREEKRREEQEGKTKRSGGTVTHALETYTPHNPPRLTPPPLSRTTITTASQNETRKRAHKVMIWDDHQSRCIGELSFRSEVKAVRLRRDRVVVVLAQRIYVYRFSDLHLLDRINTIRNDQGLVALCADASNMVLACPGVSRGHVNVELYDLRRSTLIPAHESELAQVCISYRGEQQ